MSNAARVRARLAGIESTGPAAQIGPDSFLLTSRNSGTSQTIGNPTKRDENLTLHQKGGSETRIVLSVDDDDEDEGDGIALSAQTVPMKYDPSQTYALESKDSEEIRDFLDRSPDKVDLSPATKSESDENKPAEDKDINTEQLEDKSQSSRSTDSPSQQIRNSVVQSVNECDADRIKTLSVSHTLLSWSEIAPVARSFPGTTRLAAAGNF